MRFTCLAIAPSPTNSLLWDWEFLLPWQPPQYFIASFEPLVSSSVSPALPAQSATLLWVLLASPVSHTRSATLPHSCLSAQLPVSTPSTSLDECFFNSLVVRVPCSLIFWQFWFLLFLDWLLSFFWLCKEMKHFYLCLHPGWNSHKQKLLNNKH